MNIYCYLLIINLGFYFQSLFLCFLIRDFLSYIVGVCLAANIHVATIPVKCTSICTTNTANSSEYCLLSNVPRLSMRYGIPTAKRTMSIIMSTTVVIIKLRLILLHTLNIAHMIAMLNSRPTITFVTIFHPIL